MKEICRRPWHSSGSLHVKSKSHSPLSTLKQIGKANTSVMDILIHFFFPCIEASVTGNGFETFYECSEIKAWGTELVVQIIFSWPFSGIRIYELLGSTEKNTPCEQFQCLYFSTTNSISWKESRSIVLRSRSDVKDLMSQFCSNKLKLVRKMFDLIHTCWVFLQSLQESFPVFCQDIHPWVHQAN